MGILSWAADHSALATPALFVVVLMLYGVVLGVPRVRERALRRLPCLTTHTVRVAVPTDADDPAAIAAAVAELRTLTSRGRWSPAPPTYHVRTTVAVGGDGEVSIRELVVTSTTYHLRRNRAAAEAGVDAYVRQLTDEVGRSVRA